jgi:heme exporter protein A
MNDTRPIIEISGLSKAYGFVPVLRQINLSIERGQFVSLLGPNGSGKSTLLRMLSGLSKPTAGSIRIGGWEMPREAEAVRSQIGLVSHKSLLYENLTARENLQFFGGLYHVSDLNGRISHLLQRVGLEKRAHSLVRTFSRGMLQRLSIARALLHDPHVLLFDEPYTGLDQDASAVLDHLLTEARSGGRTIIMVTHQLDRAASLSDRILILSRGHIGFDSAAGMDVIELAKIYADTTGDASTR